MASDWVVVADWFTAAGVVGVSLHMTGCGNLSIAWTSKKNNGKILCKLRTLTRYFYLDFLWTEILFTGLNRIKDGSGKMNIKIILCTGSLYTCIHEYGMAS